jgi:hypothetical protein
LRLNGRDDHARLSEQSALGAIFAHLHVGGETGDPLDFVARLKNQFLAMRQHQCPAGKHAPDDIGKQHRLAAARRHHGEGVVIGEDGVQNITLAPPKFGK